MTAERVIVVGAGPAGLAVAVCLEQRGVHAQVIEASAQVGSAWRGHYERLHLHTHKGGSNLPGLRFPREYPRYPSREQVIAYLERYAKTFGITPAFDERVTRIEPADGGWAVTTAKRQLSAKQVVIATGYTRVPVQASWPGLEGFRGEVLHSSRFKNGEPFRGKRVLVVGFGNSGGEIAIDLVEHGAQPTLAVRSPVNVLPRDLFGIPILLSGAMFRPLPPKVADVMGAPLLKLAIGDFTKLGLRKSAVGPMEQIKTQGRVPLIDVGTLALAREGKLKIVPGLKSFTEHSVVFDDGTEQPFDAVVLATGYRPALEEFLPFAAELCDANGFPRTEGEVRPGLHLCGFQLSTRGMLKEIGITARHTAQRIATALA
jgi:NADPH-dependent 2,4-dienoyl-CoA reductase/sulfur reductase-like enzyme